MPRFVIELDASFVHEAIKNLTEATDDFQELLAGNVALVVQRMVDTAFRAQGRPGKPWKELQPKTLRRRRKQGRGAKILQDTGRLRQSVSASTENPKVDSHSLEVGSNLIYARIHQFGGDIRQGARSNLAATRWANVGGRLLFQGRDGKVKVASKLDGTPIRKKFATAKEKRLTFRERVIHIPARPYLPNEMTEDERRQMARALIHYLSQRLHGEEG